MGTLALGAGIDRRCKAWSARGRCSPGFHKNWNHALANIGGGLAYVAVTLLLLRLVSGPFQEMTGEGLFATLVIMAVVTTLMASPLFDRLVGSERHTGFVR